MILKPHNNSECECFFFLFILFMLLLCLVNNLCSFCTEIMSGSTSMVTGETCGSELLHVLAVDDSLVDRKCIERLLTSSSYRGETNGSLLCLIIERGSKHYYYKLAFFFFFFWFKFL